MCTSAAIKNRVLESKESVIDYLTKHTTLFVLRLTLHTYLHFSTDSESTVPIHIKATVPVPKGARPETIELPNSRITRENEMIYLLLFLPIQKGSIRQHTFCFSQTRIRKPSHFPADCMNSRARARNEHPPR